MAKPTAASERIERDSLGEVRVPAGALWGAQTQRAIANFPVGAGPFPLEVVRAIALIKLTAAQVNQEMGRLAPRLADAIARAAQEVADGKHPQAFPVDVFQTGSGTSSHMNVNEVVANRAIQLLGGQPGEKSLVHPNDHVNLGQSSNDVVPTAVHLAALEVLDGNLVPALEDLRHVLEEKAAATDGVVKVGRTHLQDALPIRLGQVFAGAAAQVKNALRRLGPARVALCELPLGGTGVGTGFGAAPGFATEVIRRLAAATGRPLVQAPNLCEALAARDALVELSAALRGLAVSLTKIANDVRWMASGPRCGLGEIRLPELQPGSSLMPGKVNPVLSEMLLMVAAEVIGNDATVAWAGASGNFELNVMVPVIARNVLSSLRLLGNGARVFAERCVVGIVADADRCAALVEHSLALATALVPAIGYDAAAALAREAVATGKTVRALARERGILPEAELDRVLDPDRMTRSAP